MPTATPPARFLGTRRRGHPRPPPLTLALVAVAAWFGGLVGPPARADEAAAVAGPVIVRSPDGRVEITLAAAHGTPAYRVSYRGKPVVGDSPLGLAFLDGRQTAALEVAAVRRTARDETYPVVAGQTATARNHCNEALVVLRPRAAAGDADLWVAVVLRAYDDGVAFRYQLPEQQPAGPAEFAITAEDSGFSLPTGATAWALPLPNHTSHYEGYYQTTKVADLAAGTLFGLPLLVELPDGGPAVAVTEANLTDYAGMYLTPADAPSGPATRPTARAGGDAQVVDLRLKSPAGGYRLLRASLSPLPGQEKVPDGRRVLVKWKAPFVTPWRVVMIGNSAADLIASNLVLNLSDPCAIADPSWVKPGKVAFPWWNGYLVGPNGTRGGVDTATYKHYVDAAAEYGFAYASIDGLDHAWYGGKIPGYFGHDITVPVPELDI